MILLEPGQYSIIAVLNTNKDFNTMNKLIDYVKNKRENFPDILTGGLGYVVKEGMLDYIDITLYDGIQGLRTQGETVYIPLPDLFGHEN